MKNPNQIIEQCDVLIAKYEEGLRVVKEIRREALSSLPVKRELVENAWGEAIWVTRRQ